MATLESIELLLGLAIDGLRDAGAQLGELGRDAARARIRAALQETRAIHAEVSRDCPATPHTARLPERTGRHRLLAVVLHEARDAERAGYPEQAIALLEHFVAAQPDPPYRELVTAELERIRTAPLPADEGPDGPMTAEEQAAAAALTPEQIARIDHELLAAAGSRFRKVAFVVGTALLKLCAELPTIVDLYYAQRVAHLVATGQLEVQGSLDRMRYSEVRLPR